MIAELLKTGLMSFIHSKLPNAKLEFVVKDGPLTRITDQFTIDVSGIRQGIVRVQIDVTAAAIEGKVRK